MGDSFSLDENDLIKFMTVYDNKKVCKDKVDGKVQSVKTDFIRKSLKFASSMEQYFLTHDPDIENAVKFQRNHTFCVSGYQELYKPPEKPKKRI
ncbi:hypothetical protein TNCV_2530311 [Trichonephila clavipes]|nr:hypothetical protein TNCV_2530311 [Trichonephila clavipes]